MAECLVLYTHHPGPWVGRSPGVLMERGQGYPRLGAELSSPLSDCSHFCTPPYTKRNL